jgi:hypothetical protein
LGGETEEGSKEIDGCLRVIRPLGATL